MTFASSALSPATLAALAGAALFASAGSVTIKYRDSLKLSQEEYDRPPFAAILQVAVACLLCAWASARAAGPLRKLSPAANQAPLAGAPFRGTAWMSLGHRGMAMPLRVGVVKPEGGRSF